MKPQSATVALLASLIGVSAAGARPQSADVEAWSSVVLESPAYLGDDRDARPTELLELIERAPDHPLVELGLRMLQGYSAERQAEFLRRCMALDGSRMTPAARGELEALRLVRAGQLAALGVTPAADVGLNWLRPTLAIGPLPDVYDLGARRALLDEPGFEREHRGYPGQRERWRACPRAPFELFVDPDEMLEAQQGWGAVVFAFRAPAGGPAWLELDFGGDGGPSWTTTRAWQEGGALAQIDDPSCDVRVNDGAVVSIDFLTRERPKLVRLPTVLRRGENHVLVALNLGARVRFSARVLAADGAPVPALEPLALPGELGQRLEAVPPTTFPTTALDWLASQRDESARTLALTGAAHLWLGESVAGAQLLERAVAADPTLVGARTWLAEFYGAECFAPQSWARGKARAHFEALLADDPKNMRAVSALAEIWAAEDREDDALGMLRAAADAAPTSPQQPLDLARLYSRLELEVLAERALLDAAQRAPDSPRAVYAVAQHWQNRGQHARATAERERALALGGASLSALGAAAQAHAGLGAVERALELRRLAARIGGEGELQQLVGYLRSLARYDEATALSEELLAVRPDSPDRHAQLADLAFLRGDPQAEKRHLKAALKLSPGDSSYRERLRDLGEPDPIEDFFRRWKIEPAAELADFDPKRWDDHVVRAIDAAAVYVFEDGSWEQLNHSRSVARDLEGCEALGSQSEQEEMLRIATVKAANGQEFEPVLVNGEYVMPVLEPGDTVEVIWRNTGGPDREGRLVLPSWSFASVEEPFFLSRYVISVPKDLGLEMVLRNFDGRHEVFEEAERIVHVLEMREVARVVPEPLAPPPNWHLPWVQFGMPRSRDSMALQARLELAASVRVTPHIAEAARRVVEGVSGQEQQARALHAFVGKALDKRSGGMGSAVGALLQREGNPAILYSALLNAAGIDNELIWSRGVDPRADADPRPAFVDLGRWLGRLLVVVRPDDGPEAWCNLGVKTMPYGDMLLDSPRAEALSASTGRWLDTPDAPLPDTAGERTHIALTLNADRSARLEVDFEPTGNTGHMWKEGLREAPKAQLKQIATRIGSQIVRGFEVEESEWPGLDNDDDLRIRTRGVHKRYLDQQKNELSCRLPFPALQMGGLARGEGERKQPFFLPQSMVRTWIARFELDPALKLVQGVETVELECGPARFRQSVRPDGERAFVVERSLLSPPLLLPPEQFPAFVAFCKQLDDLDRAKLRFERVE